MSIIASPIAERSVCGSLLVIPDELIPVCRSEELTAAHFFGVAERTIYAAVCSLADAGRAVDAAGVAEFLSTTGTLDDVGGLPDLLALQEEARDETGLRDSIRTIKQRASRRRMAERLERLQADLRDPTVTDADIQYELWEASRSAERARGERFPSLSPADLDASEFTLNYLVDDLLVEGQPAILAGGKKCLKTNISIDLALSLESGLPFLGKFRVNKTATVGILSGESGAATIQETARRIARSKGQPLQNFSGIRFCFALPRLGSPDDLRALRDWIEEYGIEVLIVDPMYLAMDDIGDGASNLFVVGKQLLPVAEMAQELGVTLIICHHTRSKQPGAYACPELEDIAWAGFQEFARQWLLIGRREKYDPENGGSHKLWLNVGGSAGHSSLWALDIEEGLRSDRGGRRWDVAVLRAREARAQAVEAQEAQKNSKVDRQRQADTQRILKAFQKFPEGETSNIIRTTAGLSGSKSSAIFSELLQSKTIEPTQIQRANGQTYDAFRLTRIHSDSLGLSDSVRLVEDHSDFPPFRGGPSDPSRPSGLNDVLPGVLSESESECSTTCNGHKPVGLPELPASLIGGGR